MSTKREIFIWKKDDDMKLLREVVHEEPYKFPVGLTKRGQHGPRLLITWFNVVLSKLPKDLFAIDLIL